MQAWRNKWDVEDQSVLWKKDDLGSWESLIGILFRGSRPDRSYPELVSHCPGRVPK